VGGKGGNRKKNRLSRDPRRLNSDKRAERQDQLHIGIQEKNTSMKNIMCDGSARLNRLGPVRVPRKYPFPSFPLSYFPLLPLFFLFSYAHLFIPFVRKENRLIGYSYGSIKTL
jgi:hypothetical protein